MPIIVKPVKGNLLLQKEERVFGMIYDRSDEQNKNTQLINGIVAGKGLDKDIASFVSAILVNRIKTGTFDSKITDEILNIDDTITDAKNFIKENHFEKNTDVLAKAVDDFYYDPTKKLSLIQAVKNLLKADASPEPADDPTPSKSKAETSKEELKAEKEESKKEKEIPITKPEQPKAETPKEEKSEPPKETAKPKEEPKAETPKEEKSAKVNKEEKAANFEAKDIKGIMDNEALQKMFQNKELFASIKKEATKFFTGLIMDDKITKEKKIEYIKYTAHSIFNLLDGIIGLGIDLSQFIKSALTKETADKLDKYMMNIMSSKYDLYKSILKLISEELSKTNKDDAFAALLQFALPTIVQVIDERKTAESQTQQKPMTQQEMQATINQLLQNRQVLYNSINQTQDPNQQQVFKYQLGEVEKLIKYYYSQLQGQTMVQNTQEAQGVAYSMEPNIFDSMIQDTNAAQYINNQGVGVIEYYNYMNNAYSSTRATIDQIHELYTAQNSHKATAEDMALVENFVKSQMEGFRQAEENVKGQNENKEAIENVEAEIVEEKDVETKKDIPPVSTNKASENKNVQGKKHDSKKEEKKEKALA